MNKYLLLIIATVVAVGGFVILGGKKENSAPAVQPEITAIPTQAAPKAEASAVILTDTGFTPKEIIVKTGARVTWTNLSGKTATVDSADHPTHLSHPFLNLGKFADKATLEVVFDKAGKYTYHNHYNSSENGSVIVE